MVCVNTINMHHESVRGDSSRRPGEEVPSEHLDIAYWRQFLEDFDSMEEHEITRLVETMLCVAEGRANVIRNAAVRGNRQMCVAMVNRLKSSSVQLRATKLTELCNEIALSAKEDDDEKLKHVTQDIKKEILLVRTALHQIL